MGHKDIFKENVIDYLMGDIFVSGVGKVRPVYQPVRHSPFEDSIFLLENTIMTKNGLRGRHYETESGFISTPQNTIIAWENYQTLHTFVKTHLSIAVKLYCHGILFEYVNYNHPSHSLDATTALLSRHYTK